jgi:hypothetical protein
MAKITCFITKATSSLDYLIPVIQRAKQTFQDATWEIVFWGEPAKILKGQKFYENFLSGVSVRDLPSMLKKQNSWWQNLLWRFPLYQRSQKVKSKKIGEISDKFLKFTKPDLILYDHREIKGYGSESLKLSIASSKIPTVLLPHAPHHTGTEAFVPFLRNDPVPQGFYYWTAFKHDRYDLAAAGTLKSQFRYVGYPGLDSPTELNASPAQLHEHNPSKPSAVLILRKIFPPEITTQPENHDNFAFFYEEFKELLTRCYANLLSGLKEFELFLKPHPSTDIKLLNNIISSLGFKNIHIDNNSIYEQVEKHDIFLSFYSTTILVPIARKKPSFIINTRIQDEIRKWEPLKNLYDQSPAFITDIDQLANRLSVLKKGTHREEFITDCYNHLRKYYPDHASDTAINEMKEIINHA